MKSVYGTMYYVGDIQASKVFYSEILNAKVVYDSEGWVELELDGQKLCLHAKSEDEEYPGGGIVIVNHDGVKALHEELKSKNVQVKSLHEIHPDGWTFHMVDASGNEVSFYGKP